jgi:sodium pump decarboxylase gamma subunit
MFGITDFTKPIVDFSNFEISQLGDALIFGGAVLLIGMATIFVILCLLWLCLILFKVFFHDLPEKRKNAASKVVEEPTKAVVEEVAPVSDDGEVIAAIAAAIAMAESESSGIKFKVVSFRRK